MIFIAAIILLLLGENGIAVPTSCWIVYVGWLLIELGAAVYRLNDE